MTIRGGYRVVGTARLASAVHRVGSRIRRGSVGRDRGGRLAVRVGGGRTPHDGDAAEDAGRGDGLPDLGLQVAAREDYGK